jgi:dihydropteridine reductase
MLGYGLSKSAAHFFVQTLGAITGKSILTKTKRKESRQLRRHGENLDTMTVVGILPTMIDTLANRSANPKANFDQWTKPKDIAKEIGTWIETPPLRPHSGSLVKVSPKTDGSRGASFLLVR